MSYDADGPIRRAFYELLSAPSRVALIVAIIAVVIAVAVWT